MENGENVTPLKHFQYLNENGLEKNEKWQNSDRTMWPHMFHMLNALHNKNNDVT